jgi:hypothetical protein
MRRAIFWSEACLAVPYFLTLTHKGRDFLTTNHLILKCVNELLWPTWYTYVLFRNTYITSFTSTCFEHYNAHHQEASIVSCTIWHITPYWLPCNTLVESQLLSWLSTSVLHGSDMPDGAWYNWGLLMMGIVVLETFRGGWCNIRIAE